MQRKNRTRLLTAGAVTGALVLTAAGVGIAQAAASPPPLAFVAATTSVTAERYVYDETEVYLSFDLGLHVIAGKDPFEIWAKRTSYDTPIVAEQVVVKNGKKKRVALPAGTVTDFSGLKDLSLIHI